MPNRKFVCRFDFKPLCLLLKIWATLLEKRKAPMVLNAEKCQEKVAAEKISRTMVDFASDNCAVRET